jgi:hypothetical protein
MALPDDAQPRPPVIDSLTIELTRESPLISSDRGRRAAAEHAQMESTSRRASSRKGGAQVSPASKRPVRATHQRAQL